jgi:hypothetical protein
MKDGAVVMPIIDIGQEVFDGNRGLLLVELDRDRSHRSIDEDDGVFIGAATGRRRIAAARTSQQGRPQKQD